jgi:energy-coupling factor transporter ATP-binding protein EcfA2
MEIGAQFGFGLRLASDLPVPGALPGDRGDAGPTIRIALKALGVPLAELGFSRQAKAIVYHHPCGLLRCENERIDIDPGEQASLQDLGELLVANALPALLWQRGAFMLHAACVRLPNGSTVAIAGPSGAGKSRLAASLVAAGAELIGDDSLALSAEDGGILAKGLPGGLFARNPDGTEREFRYVITGQARGECLLDLLIILGSVGDEVARLPPTTAVEQLLQNRHRPQVPLLLGRQAEVLAQAAAIGRQLPIACIEAKLLLDGDPIATSTLLADLARPGSCVSPPSRVGSDRH